MFLRPEQIAEQYFQTACRKAGKPPAVVLAKGALAGVFIALSVFGANTVGAIIENAGAAKLITALLFPCGLAMVLLAGGELFTGNNMMVMAVNRNGLRVFDMLKNWLLVFLGNFAGALFVAALVAFARQNDMAFVQAAIRTAEAKAALTVPVAFIRGVLCNILVCAAVWMSYSSESATGKIAAIYFPVMMFVLCGTEHCVTNMMYFPVALWLGGSPALSWSGFLFGNLLPVTLGNIVGGSLVFSGLLMLAFGKELRSRPEKEGKP